MTIFLISIFTTQSSVPVHGMFHDELSKLNDSIAVNHPEFRRNGEELRTVLQSLLIFKTSALLQSTCFARRVHADTHLTLLRSGCCLTNDGRNIFQRSPTHSLHGRSKIDLSSLRSQRPMKGLRWKSFAINSSPGFPSNSREISVVYQCINPRASTSVYSLGPDFTA